MNDAFIAYLVSFGSGCLGGLVVAGVALFGFKRGYRRVVVRLLDLEDRFLSLNGKAMAKKRWDEHQWLQSAEAQERRPVKVKYDNDPPEFEDHGVSR